MAIHFPSHSLGSEISLCHSVPGISFSRWNGLWWAVEVYLPLLRGSRDTFDVSVNLPASFEALVSSKKFQLSCSLPVSLQQSWWVFEVLHRSQSCLHARNLFLTLHLLPASHCRLSVQCFQTAAELVHKCPRPWERLPSWNLAYCAQFLPSSALLPMVRNPAVPLWSCGRLGAVYASRFCLSLLVFLVTSPPNS